MRCAASVAALLALDFFWLYLLGAGRRFLTMASGFGAEAWAPWQLALFVSAAYALLGVALCVFARAPSPREAAARGALLGLVIYGVFDFTNLAVFGRGYGLGLALSDMAWGTFVMAASAYVGESF